MGTNQNGASRPLGDRAYEAIKRDVVWCGLAPGVEVSESQLAERYGFGKAPVRAALVRLRQEGLVTPLARRGYQVAPVTIRDIKEIFQLRLVLEPTAARLAAGRVDAKELERLDDTLSVGYTPGDRQSEAAFLEANRRFHVAVAEKSGNRRLASMIDRLIEENDRILHLGLALGDRAGQFQHEHQELSEALVSGDGELAAELARSAIAGGERLVMEALLASPSVLEVPLARTESARPLAGPTFSRAAARVARRS
ncbi:MAG: GntR family transcriptional regulator [Actinobacteria bacterium]|nr:GntR family transcriptional regulator [Actinomycetota bacterium]